MDDFELQLRHYYENRRLSVGRVQEILVAGRAAASKARHAWWSMAAAAAVLLGMGLLGGAAYFRGWVESAGPQPIPVDAVADAVVKYFSDPNYKLPQVSTDRRVLVEWLRQHGGPASFKPPPAIAGLSSYGCQVLDVKGQQVYLICFLLDALLANTPVGTMPAKKMMVTVGPDGRMMKKTVPLVHLIVAPRARFSNPPKPGERIILPAHGDWNFTAWTRDDQVFVLAATQPAERLAGLAAAM